MTPPDAVSPGSAPRPRLTTQVIFGIFVIIVGVLFTLDNLGMIDAGDYLQYWPAVLVLVGALKIHSAIHSRTGWLGGAIFMAVGAWMLLAHITYITIDASKAWPIVLVALGVYLVWRGFGLASRGARPADGVTRFSSLAVMGGCSRRSNAQAFEGADLTAIMGGCEVDLRQASIAPGGEAVIDVFAFWGGIDLKVPEDWTVVTRVVPLMGGVEDKTHPPQTTVKRLVIRGLVVMGGVAVKN